MRLPLVVVAVAACGASEPAPTPAPSHDPGHGHGHGHGPMVHRFERAEDWVKVFDDPARDAWQKPASVVALLELRPGLTVADVGAGTGYFEPHLARGVGPTGKVLALDVEADMVRYLRERAAREGLANVEARQAGVSDAGLAEASVDRILVVDTWHHVPERPAWVKKLAAALRPGGRLVVVDFTLEAQQGPPKHHRVKPEDVRAELVAAGLAAEIATEDLPDQYVVVGKRP